MSPRIRTLAMAVTVAAVASAITAWVLQRTQFPLPPELPPTAQITDNRANAAALTYTPQPLGAVPETFGHPLIMHLQIADLDHDGLNDVVYCEAATHSVRWIRQAPRGTFNDSVIAADVPAPVHVWVGDVNADGRRDVLVASMGQLFPTNDRIGAVVALENLDNRNFRRRDLRTGMARVSDVRGANFTGHTDGRLDLVVGAFGYAQGETHWLENRGDWQFAEQVVNRLSGVVNTPIADFDGDRRPDFAALVSQEWEEIHFFRNEGRGQFQASLLWGSTNEDYGSSGLEVADLNRDGRPDLISTNGDGFDYPVPGGRAWHGLQWLENQGDGRFAYRRIGDFAGTYSPRAADLDGDGDIDLVAVSCFADWADPAAVSLMAWLNDGHQQFTPVPLAQTPTHLVTADVGDLDGDGVPEIVTGALHAFPPYENLSSVTLWRRQ